MHNQLLLDLGNMYVLFVFGLGFGIFSFIVTVLVEAGIMRQIFQLGFFDASNILCCSIVFRHY